MGGFNQVVVDGHVFYTCDLFDNAVERFESRIERFILFGKYDVWKKRQLLNEDNRKWAWIVVGRTRLLAWVDNKTMRAYKSDAYKSTWMEWKRFTFERWATSFDL